MTTIEALQDFNKASPPKVGTLTKEGIYIGRLKGRDGVEKYWFADVTDAQNLSGYKIGLDFDGAAMFTKILRSLGHDDWSVPPAWDDRDGRPDVLGAMFKNKNTRDFKGTFNETGVYSAGWYRSSSPYYDNDVGEKVQRFSDGAGGGNGKANKESVRPVRSLDA